MGVKFAVLHILRILIRLALFTFALTSPITIFPIIFGIGGGVNFHFWNHGKIEEHINSFTVEAKMKSSLSYWNVPGALTIHEFFDQKAPFHIPSLDSFDWAKKLDLIMPNEHQYDQATGMDMIGSLNGLVRKTDPTIPRRYWVYVTSLPAWMASPWDEAFSSLLQHLYVHPLPSDTDIFYLDCARAGFLCGVWGVKNPALVHFEVEDTTLADLKSGVQHDDPEDARLPDMFSPEYTYAYPDDALQPVTARIIELPLECDEAIKLLPRSTFPSPILQLRTLILDLLPDDIHALWDEYSPSQQIIRRFQDRLDFLTERRGTLWYYLNEADNWYTYHILEPILGETFVGQGGALADIENILFNITTLVAELVRIPFRIGWFIYSWFSGLGWDGLPLGTHTLPDEWVNSGNGAGDAGGADGAHDANMWDDMMAGFWEIVMRNISIQENEKAGRAAVTENADS